MNNTEPEMGNEVIITNHKGWEVLSRYVGGGLFIIAFDTYGNCIGSAFVDNVVGTSVALKHLAKNDVKNVVTVEELFYTGDNNEN